LRDEFLLKRNPRANGVASTDTLSAEGPKTKGVPTARHAATRRKTIYFNDLSIFPVPRRRPHFLSGWQSSEQIWQHSD
jgi:hypothetical protein